MRGKNGAWKRLAMVVGALKPSSKVGATLVEDNGSVVTVREGKTSDSHFISPEADPERFRMVGALGEMLFEEAKKTFGLDSLLVIGRNKDFNIVMFPRNGGLAVWKTNLEIDEILHTCCQGKDGREKSAREE